MVALLGQLFFVMHGIISYIRPMKNRKWLLLPFFFLHAHFVAAQLNAYQRSIQEHRQAYKEEFLTDENSPLKKEDTAFLRFFEPHSGYIVPAHFEKIEDKSGFDMQTHNGVLKKYFIYGFVTFTLQGKNCTLFIYQSEKLRTKAGMEDHLFIPFTDNTNYEQSFGGGRYLDFKIKDIQNNKLIIDFNKCYNPYCAYKEGYACPIPPKENDLTIRIEAGEKLFAK